MENVEPFPFLTLSKYQCPSSSGGPPSLWAITATEFFAADKGGLCSLPENVSRIPELRHRTVAGLHGSSRSRVFHTRPVGLWPFLQVPKRFLEKHFVPPRQAFSNSCWPGMFSLFYEILQAEVLVFESNRHRLVLSQNLMSSGVQETSNVSSLLTDICKSRNFGMRKRPEKVQVKHYVCK